MQFIENGPDIPDGLIAAQERGEVVFLCGAGVSKTAGLPTFKELVEKIYSALNESWEGHPAEQAVMEPKGPLTGQYDRMLRALERRIAYGKGKSSEKQRDQIQKIVLDELKPRRGKKLENHLALLALSVDALGRSRLVTTNFDTLFERSWIRSAKAGLPSHAGPAMPAPGSPLFEGVFHVHGRLGDARRELKLSQTGLVLTSAEFGEAYLRSGWAARYIYDLVRANVVVLVGYQAEDPPMRYLLEVLDDDRTRFPDLHEVYAFAPFDNSDPTGELWTAKGVQPINYGNNVIEHDACYSTIREWQDYARDPSKWRTDQLHKLTSQSPDPVDEKQIPNVLSVLGHGDATAILADVNPGPEWFETLVSHRLFDDGSVRADRWISRRVSDPEVLKACAGRFFFDNGSVLEIERALEEAGDTINSTVKSGWRALLQHQRKKRQHHAWIEPWFRVEKRVKAGEFCHEIRQAAIKAVRPTVRLSRPFMLRIPEGESNEFSSLSQLLWVDYRSSRDIYPEEILKHWPQSEEAESKLLIALVRALCECLDGAEEIGFVQDFHDRSSSDVRSVSHHSQNANQGGFLPIIRLIADCWERLADRCPDRARTIAAQWPQDERLLFTRLFLHAHCHRECFAPDDVVTTVLHLDDFAFWISDARREVMRLLAERWSGLPRAGKEQLEQRIISGPPREMFADGAFENDEWDSLQDHKRFIGLKRIISAGGSLGSQASKTLKEIEQRHPKWTVGKGDRDDFNSWSEMRTGPQGDPKVFEKIPTEEIVDEGIRLNQEQSFDAGQAWRLYCQADPLRALDGLSVKADQGNWEPWAWKQFFWGTTETNSTDVVLAAAKQLERMPQDCVLPLTHDIACWLRSVSRKKLLAYDDREQGVYFSVWDRISSACFSNMAERRQKELEVSDIVTTALNEDGGILADTLIERMWSEKPKSGAGFSDEYSERFNTLLSSEGRAGTLARVRLTWDTSLLHQVAPEWTMNCLLPRFEWSNDEARFLWTARSKDRYFVGPPELFDALKSPFLQAFEQLQTDDSTLSALVEQLLYVSLWRTRPKDAAYDLNPKEAKRVLSTVPNIVRHEAARTFFQWIKGSDDDESHDPAARWREEIGPLFLQVWPRDVTSRDEDTTKRLMWMAIEAGEAFPEVVDAILAFLVPFDMYRTSIELRQDRVNGKKVMTEFPHAFVRLLDALIDVTAAKLPDDLGTTLDACEASDETVTKTPEFQRLSAAWRKRAA